MSNDNPAVGGGGLPPEHTPDAAQHPGAPAIPDTQHVGAAHQLPAPQHTGAVPQHLADGPTQAPGAPQHALNPQQATAPQHAGSPTQGPAAPQHAASPAQAPGAQHAGSAPQGPAAQHAGSPLEAPRHGTQQGLDAAQHGGHTSPSHAGPDQLASSHAGAPAQHAGGSQAGVSAGKGPLAKLRHLRHARPRMHMLIVGGGAAAAVTVGALAVAKAGSDDAPRRGAAPTTSTIAAVAVTDPGAPVTSNVAVAAVVSGTDEPTADTDTTVAETTIPVTEATTALPALASGAGNYAVTVANIMLNGAGISSSLPGDTQTWGFTGPCDGVGDCSISAAGGEVALSTGAGASIFSGPGSQIALVPAGGGTYTSTFGIPVDTCGSATANISITVGGGVVTGDYAITFSGSADCPLVSLSASFSGTAA